MIASLCNRLQGMCKLSLRPAVRFNGALEGKQLSTSSVKLHTKLSPTLSTEPMPKSLLTSFLPLRTFASSFASIQKTSTLRIPIELQLQLCKSEIPARTMATLDQMHKTGPHRKFRPPRKPLDGKPMMKGVILKTLIKKPKKPNSANRKCVLVRLSNGREAIAYVPGIGHNLQEHNIVLVRVGRLQDVPGVKLKCIRGKYDLPHVQKPQK